MTQIYGANWNYPLSQAALANSGGGDGSSIDSVGPFNSAREKLETGGQTWLRSGYVETNASTYPDASKQYGISIGTAPTIEVISSFSRVGGVTSDGSTVYVTGTNETTTTTNRMARYSNSTGALLGVHSLSGISGKSAASCNDGTYIYLNNQLNNSVRRFSLSNGTGGVDLFDYSPYIAAGSLFGLETDGVNIFALSHLFGVESKIVKYTMAGVFVESIVLSDLITDSSNVTSLLYLSQYNIFIIGNYVLDSGFNILSELGGGLIFDGAYSSNSTIAYTVQSETATNLINAPVGEFVGIKDAKTDTDSGLPIYTRVK